MLRHSAAHGMRDQWDRLSQQVGIPRGCESPYDSGISGIDRAVDEMIRRCHVGLDAEVLLRELATRLARVVPFDGGHFGTTDPATGLLSGGFLVEDDPQEIPRFVANEYLDHDVMKFRDLADGAEHVDWLDRATHGQRDASPRYRNLFMPRGMADELRAAFVSGGVCWGVMCISRERNSPAFTDRDAQVMGRLVPHIGDGLRTSTLLEHGAVVDADADGPGVLVLSGDLNVIAMTPAAERWLTEIDDTWQAGSGLPYAVYSAVTTLWGLDSATTRSGMQPRVRVRAKSGRWLAVHASHLAEGDHQTAVVLEPAGRTETIPLLFQSFALTRKECEVARLVLLGRSTKEISAALYISDHTVQDHLKSIFEKSGTASRRELVAQILHEQYVVPR